MNAAELNGVSLEQNSVCKQVVDSVVGAVASALADLQSGQVMNYHCEQPTFELGVLVPVAQSAALMFQSRGLPHDPVDEIMVSYPRALHFYKLIRNKQAVLLLITQPSASQGHGWASLRSAVLRLPK